mgnify:CR=1 FL=1
MNSWRGNFFFGLRILARGSCRFLFAAKRENGFKKMIASRAVEIEGWHKLKDPFKSLTKLFKAPPNSGQAQPDNCPPV